MILSSKNIARVKSYRRKSGVDVCACGGGALILCILFIVILGGCGEDVCWLVREGAWGPCKFTLFCGSDNMWGGESGVLVVCVCVCLCFFL